MQNFPHFIIQGKGMYTATLKIRRIKNYEHCWFTLSFAHYIYCMICSQYVFFSVTGGYQTTVSQLIEAEIEFVFPDRQLTLLTQSEQANRNLFTSRLDIYQDGAVSRCRIQSKFRFNVPWLVIRIPVATRALHLFP